MNRELYIHTLRMLREQYEIARMDTVVETIDAALAEFERPTDSDCISRQAAIDAVNSLTYPSSLVDVKRKLVALPSVQPEPQWIPCTSTKRPKNREEVMVTIDNGYQRYTDTDEFVNGQYWYHDDKQVVAWKSFDEPWRGER